VQESDHEGDHVQPFWERSAVADVLLQHRHDASHFRLLVFGDGVQVAFQLILGALVSEEDLEDPFELQRRRRARCI
jgi:hypothetical protein